MDDNNIEKIKQNFREKYYNAVLPVLMQYETERKQKLLALIILLAIPTALFIYVMNILLRCSFDEVFGPILLNIALYSVISWGLIYVYSHNFGEKIKQACMPALITCFGDAKWIPEDKTKSGNSSVQDDEIRKSNLDIAGLSYCYRYDNDRFEGNFKDINYKIIETELTTHANKGTIFKGVIIMLKSNKYSYSKTIIKTKGAHNTNWLKFLFAMLIIIGIILLPAINDMNLYIRFFVPIAIFILIFTLIYWIVLKLFVSHSNKTWNIEDVNLEDPIFTKKFDVVSDDQVESRYLITPSFMERFLNIKTAFKTENITCSFYGDNIALALPTKKNLFEIGDLFHPLNNSRQCQELFDELLSILMLIDYFNLDKKLGL